MAIIYTYPKVTAESGDLVVITDVSDSNKTKQVTIESIGAAITKVDSIIAGPGISVSAPTGNVTISNTGVLDVVTTDGTFIDLTPNAPTTGSVTVTADLSATGTPNASTFLRGDNTWASPAGSGTVTSVGTTNSTGVSSGISFAAAPNPIVGTGTITLGFSGTIGDILYADTASTLAKLPAGTNTHVLTSNGPGVAPSWQAAATGSMTSWTLSGDGGPSQTITDGNTVDIAGGTVISTAASATDTVTINHDTVTRTNTPNNITPGFGGTFSTIDSITSSAEGHITNVRTTDVTLPTNPSQPAVDWNNQLALIGARTANVTTTGAQCIWAQGIFTSNQAQYKLIDDYCYLEFDLQFISVAGWGTTPAPPSMYALVNLPFNVAQPTEFEQGFGIVTEATEAFAGHILTSTTLPFEPEVDIIQFQDSKRGDRGSVNSFSAPPAPLIPGGPPLPTWAANTWNGSNTNYMCFTYPNFFQGDIVLTPHYALNPGRACNIRGNIIYRVNVEQPLITPPDENYAGD